VTLIASTGVLNVATGSTGGFTLYAGADVTCDPQSGATCTQQFGSGLTGMVGATATPVPAPVVGMGLPGLVVACGGLIALARRRRRRGCA
jgi:hypothetical protein